MPAGWPVTGWTATSPVRGSSDKRGRAGGGSGHDVSFDFAARADGRPGIWAACGWPVPRRMWTYCYIHIRSCQDAAVSTASTPTASPPTALQHRSRRTRRVGTRCCLPRPGTAGPRGVDHHRGQRRGGRCLRYGLSPVRRQGRPDDRAAGRVHHRVPRGVRSADECGGAGGGPAADGDRPSGPRPRRHLPRPRDLAAGIRHPRDAGAADAGGRQPGQPRRRTPVPRPAVAHIARRSAPPTPSTRSTSSTASSTPPACTACCTVPTWSHPPR